MTLLEKSLPAVVFFGTPEFALPALERMRREGFPLQAIVTQTDKPAGRGRKLTAPPVKDWALCHSYPLLQPLDLRNNPEFVARLAALEPQVIVVVAYGLILPKEILELPPLGSVNLHPSLLPRYRGASPVETAILRGDRETGVTTILMNEQMDAGPILLQEKVVIGDMETGGELTARLSQTGAELVTKTLKELAAGKLEPRPQDPLQVTYAKKLRRDQGMIDWRKSARQIYDLIRAFSPRPGPYTFYQAEKLNVLEAGLGSETPLPETTAAAGQLLDFTPDGAGRVAAGGGEVLLKKVRPAGRDAMTLAEYARGRGLGPGQHFRRAPVDAP